MENPIESRVREQVGFALERGVKEQLIRYVVERNKGRLPWDTTRVAVLAPQPQSWLIRGRENLVFPFVAMVAVDWAITVGILDDSPNLVKPFAFTDIPGYNRRWVSIVREEMGDVYMLGFYQAAVMHAWDLAASARK